MFHRSFSLILFGLLLGSIKLDLAYSVESNLTTPLMFNGDMESTNHPSTSRQRFNTQFTGTFDSNHTKFFGNFSRQERTTGNHVMLYYNFYPKTCFQIINKKLKLALHQSDVTNHADKTVEILSPATTTNHPVSTDIGIGSFGSNSSRQERLTSNHLT
jgi:hypothetical protein